jgi:uncharacterized protein
VPAETAHPGLAVKPVRGEPAGARSSPAGPVVDGCAFHEWPSPAALAPYLSAGWRGLIEPGGGGRAHSAGSVWRYEHPLGGSADDAFPAERPPGSDPDLLIAQTIADDPDARLVLGYHDGLLTTAFPQPRLAHELVRAANDWTLEQWLERDPRLYGMVLIQSTLPVEAAAEIRRVGSSGRMVAVALGTNGLGHHFGHPVYAPIHAAAAELGLPLVLQVGCDATSDQVTLPTAVGLPATYAEYDVHSGQALVAHVASFITEGVFERHPDLRVLLVGGGVAWLPWFQWNLDYLFRMVRRFETPWLTRPPSAYFEDHIRLGTYSLEAPTAPGRLAALLETVAHPELLLVYTSGYPRRDYERPDTVAARLPNEWHRSIFRDNALSLFRFPQELP